MKRGIFIAVLCAALGPLAILAFQSTRHSQRFEQEMQDPVDDPPDAEVKAEWAFGRLRYRSGFGGGRFGGRRSSWGIDSNRADRLFSIAMRRLTRVDSRSVEEVI